LILVFSVQKPAAWAMNSSNFAIGWDSVNSGGDDVSSSTNYGLRDTVGEQAAGDSSSTNFTMQAGYRVGDQDVTVLSFILNTEEGSTQTAYTAFSTSSKTVTVASVAPFSVGNLIGVVENIGLSERIAVGKITDITSLIITVDRWDGQESLITSVPSGGNDSVFRMNGSTAALGTLTPITGNTSLSATQVTSNAQNGYTIAVNEDGNLRVSTSTFIAGVTDGSVTIGAEEYGAQVFGSSATGTGSDFSFTTSTRNIQHSDSRTSFTERVGLVYKAAISPSTPSGNFSHIVYYTLTPNY
jgi:hypothetical protein